MRLFLIRHGESVDNVAGLYSGVRDSPLTSHGVLQARRLADHLASRVTEIGPLAVVYSSNLQRATVTARIVADAQRRKAGPRKNDETDSLLKRMNGNGDEESLAKEAELPVCEIRKRTSLRERDFGFKEGKKFGTVSAAAATSPGSNAPETTPEMRTRVDQFLSEDLQPHLLERSPRGNVAVVAHGLILGVLLRAILERHGPGELSSLSDPGVSTHLISWSNTGHVELEVAVIAGENVSVRVLATNIIVHLQGLRKTRGGIGSAKFDSKQKIMDAFFGPDSQKQKTKDSEREGGSEHGRS